MTRHGVYDVLNKVRQTQTHVVPLGVSLEPCAMCHKSIGSHDEAMIYQESKEGRAKMVHGECAEASLVHVIRAFSRLPRSQS